MMGWVKKIPLPHECPLPAHPDAAEGSVWQCRECDKLWGLTENGLWVHPPGSPPPGGYIEQRYGTGPLPLEVDPPLYDYTEKKPKPYRSLFGWFA